MGSPLHGRSQDNLYGSTGPRGDVGATVFTNAVAGGPGGSSTLGLWTTTC